MAFQEYKINIEENDEIGKEVFQVHAVDFDSPPFNKIIYKITNNDLLRVDSNTGKLFINRKVISRVDNGLVVLLFGVYFQNKVKEYVAFQ